MEKKSFGHRIKERFKRLTADRTGKFVFVLVCFSAVALCVLAAVTLSRTEKVLFETDLSSGEALLFE
ncbi:MAG: hypothetical protein IKX06_00560, partial [Clostridia bacterium]|nr:hypothetical protein [Clostridia bacterium]